MKGDTKVVSQPPNPGPINFSFRYYDHTADTYCLSKWDQEQIKRALHCLREISTKTFHELKKEARVRHFYEVVWEKTIKPTGFPFPQANDMQAFHFALIGVNGQLARVYGAFAGGTFYIVWFDLHHQIWPTQLKHT